MTAITALKALADQPALCAPAADGVCESLDCPNHKPAQRTWVGLTEDEVFAVSNTMPYGDRFDFAEAIEAKLKEKNT